MQTKLDVEERSWLAVSVLAWAAAIAGVVWMTIHPASAHAEPMTEDSDGWSCVDNGNRVCGPGNHEGKPAACYDDGGVIVAYWPCSPWTPDK